MKKGKMIAATLVVAMLVSGATGVKAAEVEKASTNVGIGFTSDESQPGGSDALAISWFPTDLNFGNDHEATPVEKTFPVLDAQSRWIEVKDERLDAGLSVTNWILNAELSDLTAGANTMTGVKLNLKADADLYDNTGNLSAPSTNLPVYTGDAVASATTFALQPNATTPVMKQDKLVSASERVAMHLTDIELVVPGPQVQGAQYTGTVTWTLDDTL